MSRDYEPAKPPQRPSAKRTDDPNPISQAPAIPNVPCLNTDAPCVSNTVTSVRDFSDRLAVVIPAFNEAATIRDVVEQALRLELRIIVVDDGSRDATFEAVKDLPVEVLQNASNTGKGASLWRGFQLAIKAGAQAVVTLDADRQHDPDDIGRLVTAWKANPNSIVIGARTPDWRRIHSARFIANRTADFWISWAAGLHIQDTQSGFRVYPASLLRRVSIKSGRTRSFVFESEILIKAARLGYTTSSVPIATRPRAHGDASHYRPVVDTLRIAKMLCYQLLCCAFSPAGLYRAVRGRDRRWLPFCVMHLLSLGVFSVGYSWTAAATAAFLYFIRLFAITAFYHRFFSHQAFKTSRALQLISAVIGSAAVQRGPLWWAAHHRYHHRHSDTPQDVHSPARQGLFWSHLGWFTLKSNNVTRLEWVPDFAAFPELRLLDRFDAVVPLFLAAALYATGSILERTQPALETNGLQMLVWGFFISTVALYHTTFTINSLAHRVGRVRYLTDDESRNSFALALLTWGEGWHNNHHHYPSSARQGFYWWEIDLTYYVLVGLSWVGLVWDLRPVPPRVLESKRAKG